MERKINAEFIINKYLDGEASEKEQNLVERFYLDSLTSDAFKISGPSKELKSGMWKHISAVTRGRKKTSRLWPAITVAAGIILIGYYIFSSAPKLNKTAPPLGDFTAASNRATITLASGRILTLNGQKSSLVVGDTSLRYADGSQVSFSDDKRTAGTANNILTASTPKGGTYSFVLADGSRVWLNADSKLYFPQRFHSEGTRNVTLEGEAYFEIQHDEAHPFIVKTANQSVRVLGTHFDIKAYRNEPAEKTILLEGSVRVNDHEVLAPGQLCLAGPGKNIEISQADLTTEMAWKNGLFVFNDASLELIMREVSRWYNIDVIYAGNLTNETYNGTIDRKANLSRILNILKKAGVRFETKGNTLIVTP
jgi:ferric-dicitrate binding protein FerR (iron transport regulator)